MTIDKLTDEFSTLREAAKRYQAALAWYQSNVHSEPAMRAWDAATSEFMQIIGSRETDIIAGLLSKLSAMEEELQEYRKAASKPVGWTDEQELRSVDNDGCGYLFKANPVSPNADPRRVILLYASAQNRSDS